MKRIYLDNAATTALDQEVLQAMMPWLQEGFGNPSSLHFKGREARIAIEESRKMIASLLGVKASNLLFTSGGTESNNQAIYSALHKGGCDVIITSALEHHSVLNTLHFYADAMKLPLHYVRFYEDGTIEISDLVNLLKKFQSEGKKPLVCLMHANNETGMFSEASWIAKYARKYGAVFHCDCVQTIGHYTMNLSEMGMHYASASAHKFHGPKGVGLLYCADADLLASLVHGGGQERGLRAGTENTAFIVGMAAALQLSYQTGHREEKKIRTLKSRMSCELKEQFPECQLNTGPHSLYSVLSVSFPKTEASSLLLTHLDLHGICVSGGSACSGGDSHVMKVLRPEGEHVTIRFSFSKYNTAGDIDATLKVLKQFIHEEKEAV